MLACVPRRGVDPTAQPVRGMPRSANTERSAQLLVVVLAPLAVDMEEAIAILVLG